MIEVAFTSPGVIVGAAKDVVPVKVEAASMVSSLIRRTPWAEAVVCSAGRPGAPRRCCDKRPCRCCESGNRPHGAALEKSGGQSRTRRCCVLRDDPRRERCFRLVVAPRGKLEVEVVYCRASMSLRKGILNWPASKYDSLVMIVSIILSAVVPPENR